jgi:23S rRNA (uracil1939-C5)-methyltransferase
LELHAYDAVVFDPPRAGAAAQAAMLAKSEVARLVAVSCNPGTLARDLRILVDGGYRIARVALIDQFLFSPHVETVAHLER